MEYLEKLSLRLAPLILISLVGWLIVTAAPRLGADFFFQLPGNAGRSGGIGPILLNTFIVVGAALSIAIPVSFAASISIVDARTSGNAVKVGFAIFATRCLEIGLSMPRLVWGLAGAAIFGHAMGLGISAATGVLTLSALLMPILSTGFIDALDRAHSRYGLVCATLGYMRLQTMTGPALRAALPAMMSSVLVGVGRALGDAAALILTAGFGSRYLEHWSDSSATLAVHIFKLAFEIGGGLPSAAATSLVLLILMATLQIPLILLNGGSLKARQTSH